MTDTPDSGPTPVPLTNKPFSDKINFVDPENLPATNNIPNSELQKWENQKKEFKEKFDPTNPPSTTLD